MTFESHSRSSVSYLLFMHWRRRAAILKIIRNILFSYI